MGRGARTTSTPAQALFDSVRALGYTPYDPATGAEVAGPQAQGPRPAVQADGTTVAEMCTCLWGR